MNEDDYYPSDSRTAEVINYIEDSEIAPLVDWYVLSGELFNFNYFSLNCSGHNTIWYNINDLKLKYNINPYFHI